MVVVSINGGLGNQLFQYAFGKNLACIHQCDVQFDLSAFKNPEHRPYALPLFNTTVVEASSRNIPFNFRKAFRNHRRTAALLNRLLYPRKIIIQKEFHFNSSYIEQKNNAYFWGYWQSEKYFEQNKDEILNDLDFSDKRFNSAEINLRNQIEKYESVCLHVRRGDYLNNSLHPICELAYYQQAVALMEKKLKNPFFFIFSDDINWCKENLQFLNNFEFVDTGTDWRDLRLMTYCKHNIIANSSFSWWGAYLGKYPGKLVVSPKQWFTDPKFDTSDLKPRNWVSI